MKRILTLANGERFEFKSNVHILFETDSLMHASQATISRCGIIQIPDDTLEINDMIQSWLLLPFKGNLFCFYINFKI